MKRTNVSALLFVGSIVGVVATAVTATIATKKAVDKLNEVGPFLEKEPINETYDDEEGYVLTTEFEPKKGLKAVPDVVRCTWKYYIPTAAVMAGTISCMVAGKRLDMKAIASLTALSSSSMYLVNKYREKIKDYANEEILSQIDKEIAIERKEKKDLPVHTGCEDNEYIKDERILMYDKYTGVWFETTRLAFVTAAMTVNQTFAFGSRVPLKMFYNMQGADLPEEFDSCLWDWEDFNDGYIWIEFYHEPKYDKNGSMYYELTYNIDPYRADDRDYLDTSTWKKEETA